MKHYDVILACGDIHAKIEVIPRFLRNYNIRNAAIIQVGDFGIGFKREKKEIRRLDFLNKILKIRNSDLYVVRGNHDNPSYFTGNYDTSNIKLVPDYTVLTLNLMNILCVGGANSVDRTTRKGYKTWTDSMVWWTKENFIYDHDKIMSLRGIDAIVTHSAPNVAYPYVKGNLDYWSFYDKSLLSDVRIERAQLTNMWENLSINNNISKWYYGHFHISNQMMFKNTTFVALNINEFKEIKL